MWNDWCAMVIQVLYENVFIKSGANIMLCVCMQYELILYVCMNCKFREPKVYFSVERSC